ncbi:GH25 family lysozyme [Lactobacillus sp.]|uniref:GH25 family lysozyme n=1 Tax=Lactobacillus sp. TaxID=1591 RepID=UPI0019C4F52C|nr:GH25 family lysozyme [Lactobacillus sp.]MBD5429728.1 glycoside hydrolase family 25 [Lactobacillus sp.]
MLKMVDVYSESPSSYATQTGVDVTMVKATQGTSYVNPHCDRDYQAAKKAGKLLGFYHYCSGGSPVKEAEYFYKNTKNYVGEAVPAVDWEEYQNSSWGDTSYVRKFVDRYHELSGVWPLIYVQQSSISQVANCAKDCGLWVAWYASMNWKSWTLPNANFSINPWSTYTIWQFTGDNMDRNIVNTTHEGWKKFAQGDKATTKKKTTWVKKSGTFTLGQDLNIHTKPQIDAPSIAKLSKGSVVKYDATLQGPLRLWLRQPRSNGTYGYMVGKDKYGKSLGKFD